MRKTKKINGHYRKRKKGPQFSTVAEMLAYTAELKRQANAKDPRVAIGAQLAHPEPGPLEELTKIVEEYLGDHDRPPVDAGQNKDKD